MLRFKFVQEDEFEMPYYTIISDGEEQGLLEWVNGQWGFTSMFAGFYADQKELYQIAGKIHELNKSTRAQRILGVF